MQGGLSFSLGAGLGKKRPRTDAETAAASASGFDLSKEQNEIIRMAYDAVVEPKTKLTIPLPAATASASLVNDMSSADSAAPGSRARKHVPAELYDKLFPQAKNAVRPAGPGLKLKARKPGARDEDADLDDDLGGLPDGPDIRSSAYAAVPIEDFGAALLRGMGVGESQIEKATSGYAGADADDDGDRRPAVLGAAPSSRPGPTGNRDRRGLGAVADPLTKPKSLPSLPQPDNGSATRSVAAARAAASHHGLRERCPARVVSAVGATATASAASSSAASSAAPGTAAGAGLAPGRIVMVWQLGSVPGLMKIRVRIPPPQSSSPAADGASSGSEVPPPFIIGLREVQPLDEALLLSSSGQPSDAAVAAGITAADIAVWHRLVAAVKLEDAAAAKKAQAAAADQAKKQQQQGESQAASTPAGEQHQDGGGAGSSSNGLVDTGVGSSGHRGGGSSSSSSSSSSAAAQAPASRAAQPSAAAAAPPAPVENWLVPGISVRIVDDRWRGGRHFKMRGVIQDVPQPRVATLLLAAAAGQQHDRDRQQVLEDVPQRVLETALPKTGGYALVLRGKHKRVQGEVLERDSSREVLVIRCSDSGKAVSVGFDDAAEYQRGRDNTH